MNKYYNLLGLHIDEVINFFKKENKNYVITTIKGYKDQDKLIIPKVIKIVEKDSDIEYHTNIFF